MDVNCKSEGYTTVAQPLDKATCEKYEIFVY